MNTVVEEQRETLFQTIWGEHRGWVISIAVLLLSLILWKLNGGDTVFPESWIQVFPFADKIDEFDKWLRPFLQPTTRAIGRGNDYC